MKHSVIDIKDLSDSKEVYDQRPNPIIPIFIYILVGLLLIGAIYCCIGQIEIVARANGVIRPNDSVSTISSLISGRVTGVFYTNGQVVKKDNLLLTVDTSEMQISLDSMEATREDYVQQLTMLDRFLDGIENKENPFSSDPDGEDYPYYVRYRDYALALKNSERNFEYDAETASANINTSGERIAELQKKIDGLIAYKNSVQQGENLAVDYPEYEKLYLSYLSSVTSLADEYEQQQEKILLDHTEESNQHYQDEYQEQLDDYTRLLRSIENGRSEFSTESSTCKLLYDNYCNTVDEYMRSYQSAQDTYNYYLNGGEAGNSKDDYLAYDRTMLEGYNYYKQSVSSGKDMFDDTSDSSYYRTLYTKYKTEYDPLLAMYDNAVADYAALVENPESSTEDIAAALSKKESAEKACNDYREATLTGINNSILQIEATIAQKEISIGVGSNSYNIESARVKMESAGAAIDAYKTKMLAEYGQIKSDIETKLYELSASAASGQSRETQLANLEQTYQNSKEQQYFQTITQIDSSIQSTRAELISAKSSLRLYQIADQMYRKSVDETGQPLSISIATIDQLSAILSEQETLNRQKDELETTIQQTEAQIAQGSIRAEKDGIINEVTTITRGDTLSSGTVIGTIVPFSESEYKVQLYVSNSDIANIEVGDSIKYNLAALPSNQYGLVNGVVTSISSDTLIQDGQYSGYYLIEGSIENVELTDKDGNVGQVSVGMQVEAKIVIQKKTIIRYLLEKINLF